MSDCHSEEPIRRPRRLARTLLYLAAGATAVGATFGIGLLVTVAMAVFDQVFGFWLGLVTFTVTWLAGGLLVLGLINAFWPERAVATDVAALQRSRLGRLLLRLTTRHRILAALVTVWNFGPLTSPPILRFLGYRGAQLTFWVIVSGLILGTFWYPWTVTLLQTVRHLIDHVLGA